MQLPSLITHSGLVDHGRDLTLAANQHLFEWPGELVYGDIASFRGSAQETLAPPDWDYKRLNTQARDGNTDRASQRGKAPTSVPDISVQALRDRVSQQNPKADGPHYDIARPTQAAAFEQRLNRQDIYNPFLDEYPLRAVQLDIPPVTTAFEPQHHEGCQWVLDWFSQELLGTQLMSPEVVAALGAYNAGKVLCEYLLGSADYVTTALLAENFAATLLETIRGGIEAKLASIESEISEWASYGRSPVEKPNGEPDMLLSAVDALTATVGIYRLCDLAVYLQDWQRGAAMAHAGIKDHL